MKIETPCCLCCKDDYVQIKDRLGDVIAVCNDNMIADEILKSLNDAVALDDVKDKLLQELFT